MNELRFTTEQIVWQEVPNETSLAYLFSGCPLHCKGCHSAETWNTKLGTVLTPNYLEKRLQKYKDLITCVLFMGGEWQPKALLCMLKISQQYNLQTCLYTGLEHHELPNSIITNLTYLKTGRWIAEFGGLNNPTTNQKFTDLRNGRNLNHLFLSEELYYDSLTA